MLGQRLELLFEDLFLNPIQQDGVSVSLDTFNVFLDDLLRAPATWPVVASIIQGLEQRNATSLLSWRKQQTGSPPQIQTVQELERWINSTSYASPMPHQAISPWTMS
jgi:hypothetical protein